MAIVYPIPVDASEPDGALLIRIPKTAINSLISRDTGQSRFLFVTNSNQEVIFQNLNVTDYNLVPEELASSLNCEVKNEKSNSNLIAIFCFFNFIRPHMTLSGLFQNTKQKKKFPFVA